ncbi:hypothetical protein ABH904_003703 [Pseudomonas frederiksbergensis]
MKLAKVCRAHARWLLLGALTVESATGATMDISASFRPDPSNPHQNKFTNDTPVSGHCQLQPEFCKERDLFSLLIPSEFRSIAPIVAGHADSRRGAMFRVPGDWRRFTVRKVDSSETAQVEVRIVSIGGRYILPDTAENLVGEGEPTNVQGWHTRLWGDWTWAPPAPCQPTGGMYTEPNSRTFFWMTSNSSVCAARANYHISSLLYDRVQIGYEMRTPDPLQMSAGQYTGNLTYTVGPGMDFDMGDVMYPNDPILTLSFTLNVEHTLKVDIPPGGNKIELVPEGGWQNWLQHGRKPVRLFRDQVFNISASSRFKMQIGCEIPGLYDCMIRDPVSQRAVLVQLSVSLPDGLTDLAGVPVKRRRLLRVGQEENQKYQALNYVNNRPGTLHFEVAPEYMDYMLQPGEAANYSGNIVVIWDSEI